MRERVEALIGDDGERRLALDVPLAVRAAAAARGAEDRPVARLRHLRLVRPGRGRQAGAARARTSTTSSCRRAMALSRISQAKNRMEGPETLRGGWNIRDEQIAKIYERYLQALKDANALDFDDLLLKTVELFETSRTGPRVLRAQVQVRDGRRVPGHQPSAVPADPAARRSCTATSPSSAIPISRSTSGAGADLRNILDFEQDFGDAKVVRLEQNYRSTQIDPRRRLRRDQPEPQPQGQAAVDRPQGRRRRSSTSAATTSSKRRTSSPARSSSSAPRTSTRRWRSSIAPTRSRARLKTR